MKQFNMCPLIINFSCRHLATLLRRYTAAASADFSLSASDPAWSGQGTEINVEKSLENEAIFWNISPSCPGPMLRTTKTNVSVGAGPATRSGASLRSGAAIRLKPIESLTQFATSDESDSDFSDLDGSMEPNKTASQLIEPFKPWTSSSGPWKPPSKLSTPPLMSQVILKSIL